MNIKMIIIIILKKIIIIIVAWCINLIKIIRVLRRIKICYIRKLLSIDVV